MSALCIFGRSCTSVESSDNYETISIQQRNVRIAIANRTRESPLRPQPLNLAKLLPQKPLHWKLFTPQSLFHQKILTPRNLFTRSLSHRKSLSRRIDMDREHVVASTSTIQFMAFSKEPVAKSIFNPTCVHGPFCHHCRARVGRCILPACVCRALLESWKEDARDSLKSVHKL